jgi:hypothetical protein
VYEFELRYFAAELVIHRHTMEYAKIPPRSSSKPTPFQVSIPDSQVVRLYRHLDLAELAPETYENLKEDESVGISHAWLSNALHSWKAQYDW